MATAFAGKPPTPEQVWAFHASGGELPIAFDLELGGLKDGDINDWGDRDLKPLLHRLESTNPTLTLATHEAALIEVRSADIDGILRHITDVTVGPDAETASFVATVMLGSVVGGRREQLARSDTTNIAACLQGVDAPDTVVLSAGTQRLAEAYFT